MFKNTHIWLPAYIRQKMSHNGSWKAVPRPIHIMFCFVDHFEPDWSNADEKTRLNRVMNWVERYPELALRHRDGDGHPPRHTFFYPAEVFDKKLIHQLSFLCQKGIGEMEIHLHHDNDTEEGFRQKLHKAKEDFTQQGLLGKNKNSGETRFGFIHGNWALNNSRPDGRWCGVNNESKILKEEGCYADFTFPSAPSDTQPKKINSIYYTSSNDCTPKSHDHGVDVRSEGFQNGDLMLIQGPLALNWKNRRQAIWPKIENGDISATNPPTNERVDLWVDQRIHVQGRPEWIFVKVHSHGAPETNAKILLGKPLEEMLEYLESKYNDGRNYVLHYVSTREMYNIIKAAEAGENGNPGRYRNYLIETRTRV